MISSHPESDLKLNLMVLGSDIITMLNSKANRNRFVLVETLMSDFLKKDQRRTPNLFLYAVCFLFSIGIIEQQGYKLKLIPEIQEQPILFKTDVEKTLF